MTSQPAHLQRLRRTVDCPPCLSRRFVIGFPLPKAFSRKIVKFSLCDTAVHLGQQRIQRPGGEILFHPLVPVVVLPLVQTNSNLRARVQRQGADRRFDFSNRARARKSRPGPRAVKAADPACRAHKATDKVGVGRARPHIRPPPRAPGPSGLPSSDLTPVPGLQAGAPPGVAFAHVPTLSEPKAQSLPLAIRPWTLDFASTPAPRPNIFPPVRHRACPSDPPDTLVIR